MKDIIKSNDKENSLTVIKELHLHKHQTLIINNPKQKLIPKQKGLVQIKCLVCGSYKKVTRGIRFCSNSCRMKHQAFKHKEYIHNKNKINQEMKPKEKSWWEL